MSFVLNWTGTKCLEVKHQSVKTLHHIDFKACKNMLLHLNMSFSALRHAELKLDLKKVAKREVTVDSGSKGQL